MLYVLICLSYFYYGYKSFAFIHFSLVIQALPAVTLYPTRGRRWDITPVRCIQTLPHILICHHLRMFRTIQCIYRQPKMIQNLINQ